MKKLGDKQIMFCKECKYEREFQISEISESGEVYGICDKHHSIVKL